MVSSRRPYRFTRTRPCGRGVLAAVLAVLPAGLAIRAHETDPSDPPPPNPPPLSGVPCAGGFADAYPCNNVDLLSYTPLATFSAGDANDIWGWTDPVTGTDYAIFGLEDGTTFVDLSDPTSPTIIAHLPDHASSSIWRDMKVHDDHAFIVSEASGHGMQVYDLTQLAAVTPGSTVSATAHYDGFGSAHNIAINEDTGFAYAVGSNTCSGGLHMVDISDPTSPAFAGCFSADGYTHDVQCVVYHGPHIAYLGREICFAANEDTLTIVDVTDKSSPVQLSRTGYAGFGLSAAYAHQGWLTEDHRYLLLGDELDEIFNGTNSRTFVWSVFDLTAPGAVGTYTGPSGAIDHNMYVRGDHVYQANYRSGLRVLRMDDLAAAQLTEVASFDTYPADDNPSFSGLWSVYPFFDSGIVIGSDIHGGLFVFATDLDADGHASNVDCDDEEAAVFPGAAEVGCDGLDNDCNAATPDLTDGDTDGFTCDVDCDDTDPALGPVPSVVDSVVFAADGRTLSWDPPAVQGAPSVAYDTIRSTDAEDFFFSAVCFESDDAGDRITVDPNAPAVGDVFHYLVRAGNSCGEGPVGTDSGGQPRTVPPCF